MIARSYGFESWPKLNAYVDGATAGRLADAVRARDLAQVRAILNVRPELAQEPLLGAVLDRAPEIVRLLVEHGANARVGVYPHREATSPLAIASERGYDEIVAIFQHEEQRRRNAQTRLDGAPAPEDVFSAIASGDSDRAILLMGAGSRARAQLTAAVESHPVARRGQTTRSSRGDVAAEPRGGDSMRSA